MFSVVAAVVVFALQVPPSPSPPLHVIQATGICLRAHSLTVEQMTSNRRSAGILKIVLTAWLKLIFTCSE